MYGMCIYTCSVFACLSWCVYVALYAPLCRLCLPLVFMVDIVLLALVPGTPGLLHLHQLGPGFSPHPLLLLLFRLTAAPPPRLLMTLFSFLALLLLAFWSSVPSSSASTLCCPHPFLPSTPGYFLTWPLVALAGQQERHKEASSWPNLYSPPLVCQRRVVLDCEPSNFRSSVVVAVLLWEF